MVDCLICNRGMNVRYESFFDTRLLYCPFCGYERQETFPSDKELLGVYDEKYYKTYGDSSSSRHQKKIYFNKVLDNIKLTSASRVLEVGCGTGVFLEVCSERGLDVYGVDINKSGIDEASKIVDESNLFCSTLERLDFNEKFDAVFMFDYIEHVKNQEEVLRIAFDRLNSGGILVLTTPSTSSFSNKIMGARWPHYIKEHLSFFSNKSLNILLKKVGYKDIHIKSFNKIMTVKYLYSQMVGKSMTISPVIKYLYKFIPRALTEKTFSLNTGDVLSIAKK